MLFAFVIPSHATVYGRGMPPVYPALGPLYCASALEAAGHTAAIIDMDALRLSEQDVYTRLAALQPAAVGFSCVTPTVNQAFRIAAQVKKRFPKVTTILGGIHATIDPGGAIAREGIDIVVVGEAEQTIVELATTLENGGKDIALVQGIYYKEDGCVRQTPPRQLVTDLDAVAFPAFHLLGDLKSYSPADAHQLPAMPIFTSRGCPGTCTYCCTKQIFGRRFRMRSVENIVAEILMLIERYGVREIHFLDDTITTHRKRLLDLCAELARRRFPVRYELGNGMRADMADEEVLRALRSIGLENIGFGVESGNEEILRVIKKGITKDQVRSAMARAKAIGFETWCFFILGLPQETPETIKQTIDFAIELDPDFAKFLILKPFPGSEAFDQLKEQNLIETFDWDQYGVYTPPVHHLPTLSRHDILRWQKVAFRRFYLRPSKIARHFRRMTSVTRVLMVSKGALFILKRSLFSRIRS
jgi:anaerobic magnesium-protoporphyrin IX monomethyl ester cyclase